MLWSEHSSVQKSLHRRQTLCHLTEDFSLRSKVYDTTGHDYHVNNIPRLARTHEKQRQKTKECGLLPSKPASKSSYSHAVGSPPMYTMPERLTEMSSLTQKQVGNVCHISLLLTLTAL